LAVQTHDDGFHEIQLNGKQLVFLFMAATVVSVVIFLCGVLVGRGVRSERAGAGADISSLSAAAETVPQQPAPAAAPTPIGSDPTVAAPPPTVDDLTYFDRLQKPSSSAAGDDLKVTPTKPAAAAPVPAAAPAPPSKAVKKDAPELAPAEPQGQGYAVQVAALNVRGEADAIAKRLTLKGYAAYVLPPASGTPQVFRVRVGKFGTRREADAVAVKLQKEEQFKPWVTR
jgi:cell division septation protein DedD